MLSKMRYTSDPGEVSCIIYCKSQEARQPLAALLPKISGKAISKITKNNKQSIMLNLVQSSTNCFDSFELLID